MDQQITNLEEQLISKRSKDEIEQKRRQQLEKQLDKLEPEEMEAIRQLLAKERMLPQQLAECSIQKSLVPVDFHRLMASTTFLRRDEASGYWSIDPSSRDLLKELLFDG